MNQERRPVAIHVMTRLIRGGPTRPVLTSLDRLSRLGYRTVLVTGMAGEYEDEALDNLNLFPDLPVLRLPWFARAPHPLWDCRTLAALAGTVSRLRPSVVHTHTAKAGALGRLAARMAPEFHCRRVHTFHGHSLSREATGNLAPVWRLAERLLLWGATDLLITLSPGQRSEIIRHLGPRAESKTAVLPLGYDPSAYLGSADQVSRITEWRRPGDRLLAFVGRGVPVKGLDHLAHAHLRLAARSASSSIRLRVVVIGAMEPAVRSQVSRLLQAGALSQQWSFLGSIPNPLPLMGALDGLVLPSLSEGTPVSIIEALDAGLPVLASAVGGVPEMLSMRWERHGPGEWSTTPCAPRGLLLPPGDAEAWASALHNWIETPAFVPGDPLERQDFVRQVFHPARRGLDLDALYRLLGRQRGAQVSRSASSPLPRVAVEGQARPAL